MVIMDKVRSSVYICLTVWEVPDNSGGLGGLVLFKQGLRVGLVTLEDRSFGSFSFVQTMVDPKS